MHFRFLLFLLIPLTAFAAEAPLFDGRTFDGWEGETTKVWRIENAEIHGGSLAGNPRNEFLATKKSYRDFVLKLEYKLHGTEGFVNGGVQFRSKRIADPPNEMSGYQADIGAGYSGFLYDESRRNKMLAEADKEAIQKLEKPGEWNTYEIRCQGPRVVFKLNGTQTVDYTETQPDIEREGLIALQIHGDCKAVIAFRNITIEELPETAALNLPKAPLDQTESLKRFGDWKPRAPRGPFPDGKFVLEEDETVVFLGGEDFVRQSKNGIMEALLARAFADKAPRFRWMAVEGDTVYEQAREMNFGSWTGQLEWSGASVAICQFGKMESLDGEARLPEFVAAYHRLLDQLAPVTQRIVLVGPRWPESSIINPETYHHYVEAVREIAKQRKAVFINTWRMEWDPPSVPNPEAEKQQPEAWAVMLPDELSGRSIRSKPESEIFHKLIIEKNRLWADCWRPANWAFAYGDRDHVQFGQPGGGAPYLKEEYAMLKPRIAALDRRIQEIARGNPDPGPADAPPPPPVDLVKITPEEQLATLHPAEGFEVKLFASEALGVVKPVQISWDEKGRLYAACSPMYPHLEPGTPPGDYILICEDTNGDGIADKSWKFAENLTMVQGVEPGDGGVYVCDFNQLVHFKDTDGDGKADVRRVVYSGFGTGDTHQLINSISHGDDGRLWFSQGLHSVSRVETPYGIAVLEKAGLWRLDPKTMRLESFFNGGNAGHNCWGVVFDDNGQIFHKTGDRPEGYWSAPGLISLKNPDDYHPIGGMMQTNPKTTSIEFVGTAALPDHLQGCALTAGFINGVIEAHRLIDDGAGFRSEQLPKLLTSTSEVFRPVDVSVGPDGAIYICDFFNLEIGHYQASYRDPRRDHSHGRVWRLSAKNRPAIKQPDLASMKPEELVDQLKSPERWTRYQARRLLFDLPSDKADAATKTALATQPDERVVREILSVRRAHHLPLDGAERLTGSQNPAMRAYGARLVEETKEPLPVLEKLVTDENPRARLEAVTALARLARPEFAPVAARALDLPRDRFLDYALTQAMRYLLTKPGVDAETVAFEKPEHRAFALKAAGANPEAEKSEGQRVYELICLNCHQANGQGLPGLYPSLVKSDRVNGDADWLIKILLHGLTGPIQVNAQPFTQTAPVPMPPAGLTDEQTAAVLTWLRAGFENSAGPVTAAQVAEVRKRHEGRTELWTEEELLKP